MHVRAGLSVAPDLPPANARPSHRPLAHHARIADRSFPRLHALVPHTNPWRLTSHQHLNMKTQALNAGKAELARLESDQAALSGEIASKRQELAAFERGLMQTQAQAADVERTFMLLEAEHRNT